MEIKGEFRLKTKPITLAEHTCVETNFKDKEGKSRRNLFYCHGDWDGRVLDPYDGYPILAQIIAMYSPNLEPDRIGYNRTDGGGYGVGDCCGVFYMGNGTCHQMTNRLMYAVTGGSAVLDGYEWNVPSYKTSRAIFGPFGVYWDSYIRECLRMYDRYRGPNCTPGEKLFTAEEVPDSLAGKMMRVDTENMVYSDALRTRLDLMFEDSDTAAGNNGADVAAAVKEFSAAGHRDEPGYFENKLNTPEARDRYAKEQDRHIIALLGRINELVGEEKYKTMFGAPFDPKFSLYALAAQDVTPL